MVLVQIPLPSPFIINPIRVKMNRMNPLATIEKLADALEVSASELLK